MSVVVSPAMLGSLASVEPPVLLLSTRLDPTRLHRNTVDGDAWQNQLIIGNLEPHLASVVFIRALQDYSKACRKESACRTPPKKPLPSRSQLHCRGCTDWSACRLLLHLVVALGLI